MPVGLSLLEPAYHRVNVTVKQDTVIVIVTVIVSIL